MSKHDPGRAYLYQEPQKRKEDTTSTQDNSIPGHLTAPSVGIQQVAPADGSLDRWGAAVGNIEDARVALDTLCQAIEDAVYLDEDAYNQLIPTMHYVKLIQAQQRRIAELECELESLREKLGTAELAQKQAELQAAEATHELENNAVVFKMHYTELLAKDEELSKLKAVIQGLTGKP